MSSESVCMNQCECVTLHSACMKQRNTIMKQLKESDELFRGFMSLACQKVRRIHEQFCIFCY